MAKVQIKSETIATFGGIFHVMDVFEHLGLGRLIDSSLGNRDASWNAFRYSEVIETLFCNYLCGGDCLEDINMLAPQLSLRPGTPCRAAFAQEGRRGGRVLKSLASENISYACEKSGSSYSFNIAERLNAMLLNMVKTLGLLKVGEEVTSSLDGNPHDSPFTWVGDLMSMALLLPRHSLHLWNKRTRERSKSYLFLF